MKKIFKSHFFLIVSALFVFAFFFAITRRSPIVGDAYNYANMGLKTSPLTLARLAYFSWSGRFFSELWGFFMCSKVPLWNFLNPLFFTILFLVLNKLINPQKKLIRILFILFLMLTVENHIRTQTYTWIMGTTYVIPLMLTLLYYLVIKEYRIDSIKKISLGMNILLNLLVFYVGLSMENIAGTLFLSILCILIYFYLKEKTVDRSLVVHFLVSGLSLFLLRISPGANGRLAEYHPEWVAMSFFEKISHNIQYFVELTFTNNKVVLIIFIAFLIYAVFSKKKQNGQKIKKSTICCLIVEILAGCFIFIPGCSEFIFGLEIVWLKWGYFIFWLLFTGVSLFLVGTCLKKHRILILFFLLMGGASSACLMISPIYASRSLIYFVYFMIVVDGLMMDELLLDQKQQGFKIVFMSVLLVPVFYHYYQIYTEVARIQAERLSIIAYYLDHPEEKEAWIPRIPDEDLHSANIEEDNEYHMQTFKEYYGLSQELKVIFYNKEGDEE